MTTSIRPQHLKSGDTIGIVAPSSPFALEGLRAGVAHIEARGYRVVIGEHVFQKSDWNDYLAGDDAQRAADLETMLTRDDIQAVFCAGGGYGAMRLLPRLDWERIALRPKIFVGYSDITALHLALNRLSWITFHAPMVTALPKLDEPTRDLFWQLLENAEPIGAMPCDPDATQTIVEGQAQGELAGGCLCLLAHACGSRFAPDFRGKIILIEDVGEAVYRVDRDLWQLRNAGAFDDAAGFVVGEITGWRKQESENSPNTPDALWQEFFAPLGKPTISGFCFGHAPNPLSLPLGVLAQLDADTRTLTLLGPATQ